MKKRVMSIFIIAFIAAICLTLTSCGYNRIMRKHLSNAENYYFFVLEIEEISAFYPDGSEWFKNVECTNDINIAELDCVYLHGKIKYTDDNELSEHYLGASLRFEILKPNVEELLKTDFFDVIGIGEQIAVKTSLAVYMDEDYHYIAEVKAGDQTYLHFDIGLQNIVDFMNAHKGL